MSDLRRAAEMALEEFELFFNTYPYMEKGYTLDARTALRQALAQPEQEPVAWMTHTNDLQPLFHKTRASALNWQTQPTPLYTAPPSTPKKPDNWVGLTDEEIEEHFLANVNTGCLLSFGAGAAYAEAKLREKNT